MRFSHKFIVAMGATLALAAPFYMSVGGGVRAVSNAMFFFRSATPAPDPWKPLFMGREVSPPHSDLSVLPKLNNSNLNWQYQKIRPQTALLISNCQASSKWCEGSSVQFRTKLWAMAAIPKKLGVDTVIRNWTTNFAKQPGIKEQYIGQSTDPPLLPDRFQLLAVVNRMDLAVWGTARGRASCDPPGIKDKWTGAEVRLVYGLRPSERARAAREVPQMTIILEFVLPPFDPIRFRDLAQGWRDLPDTGDGTFPARLSSLLQSTRYEESADARIRLNYEFGRRWRFVEWDFSASSPGTRNAYLEDQVNQTLMKPGNVAYSALWANDVGPELERICIPKALMGGDGLYDRELLEPPGGARAYPITRNVLALQQCRYCHTVESQTDFQHIKNRLPMENSKISGFLLGSPGYRSDIPPLPTLAQLYTAESRCILTVDLCKTDPALNCKSRPIDQRNNIRRYHDLARRALFLATVLASDPRSINSTLVNKFGTDLPD